MADTPRIGIAMSGGGSRATAFALGVLRGLNDLNLLDHITVASGISGGSVAAAAFAYSNTAADDFEAFDSSLSSQLRIGFQSDVLLRLASPGFLLRRTGAATVSTLRAMTGRAPTRTYNRTDALADTLRARLFGNRQLADVTRQLDVVVSATDLRTTNAVRFGTSANACSAHGTILDPIDVAEAVAASAAFPLLLPPIGRTFTFETASGDRIVERLTMSDGGIYDNLGTSVFERGRSPHFSQHVYDIDYLIVCDAGRGPLAANAFTAGPWRLKRAFDVTYRKAQDRSRGHVYDALAAGHFKGVVHAYLGMPDERLPVPVADLVPLDAVRGYGTNFAAMSTSDLDAISMRGEQLVRTLTGFYCSELIP